MNFCSEQQVRDVFDALLGEQIITKVTTLQKTDDKSGHPFKIFFIDFASSNDVLTELIEDIDRDPAEPNRRHTRVQYDAAGHFWKVSKARKNEKTEKEPEPFKPTIMKRETKDTPEN